MANLAIIGLIFKTHSYPQALPSLSQVAASRPVPGGPGQPPHHPAVGLHARPQEGEDGVLPPPKELHRRGGIGPHADEDRHHPNPRLQDAAGLGGPGQVQGRAEARRVRLGAGLPGTLQLIVSTVHQLMYTVNGTLYSACCRLNSINSIL